MNEKPAYNPSSLQLIYSVLLMAQLVITVVVIYVAEDQSNVRFEWGYWNHIVIPAVAGVFWLAWKDHLEQGHTEDKPNRGD